MVAIAEIRVFSLRMGKNLKLIALFLLGIGLPASFGFPNTPTPPTRDEEILIFFQCRKADPLPESIQDYLQVVKEKRERELGAVFFLSLDSEQSGRELFQIRSGSFAIQLGSNEIKEASDTESRWKKKPARLLFEIKHIPDSKWVEQDLRIPEEDYPIFRVYPSAIPGDYRYFGQNHYLSCNKSKTELGKIQLGFRDRRLIRQSIEFFRLENWKGDL
jgi:hypothetical protein